MTHETVTSLSGADVIGRAKRFFQDRVPGSAAFPEKEGPTFLTLRGQGGEEIVIGVVERDGATLVTGASYMFDAQVSRFLATLPRAEEVTA